MTFWPSSIYSLKTLIALAKRACHIIYCTISKRDIIMMISTSWSSLHHEEVFLKKLSTSISWPHRSPPKSIPFSSPEIHVSLHHLSISPFFRILLFSSLYSLPIFFPPSNSHHVSPLTRNKFILSTDTQCIANRFKTQLQNMLFQKRRHVEKSTRHMQLAQFAIPLVVGALNIKQLEQCAKRLIEMQRI